MPRAARNFHAAADLIGEPVWKNELTTEDTEGAQRKTVLLCAAVPSVSSVVNAAFAATRAPV